MLLLHAQDLLDQRIIEHGSFVPSYGQSSVSDAILEIVDMVQLTVTSDQLTIKYNSSTHFALRFDKRRLQQVLLNLLSNAAKF